MIRISTTAIASTSRMWMNPPKVLAETIPRSQSTSRMTKIVQSISVLSRGAGRISLTRAGRGRGDHGHPGCAHEKGPPRRAGPFRAAGSVGAQVSPASGRGRERRVGRDEAGPLRVVPPGDRGGRAVRVGDGAAPGGASLAERDRRALED